MNRNNEQFGQNRFYLRVKQLADKSSSEFLSLLVTELEAHQGDAPQHDDITIVTGRTVVERRSPAGHRRRLAPPRRILHPFGPVPFLVK
jgi:hypothetical protein